jgi:hypothetical protein
MMTQTYQYEEAEAFLSKLRELLQSGISQEQLELQLPYHLPEVEQLLELRPGPLRFFALTGGLSGFLGGLGLCIYTALSWPLITGGKPIVSLPPFLIIAYLLAVLFGSLASFAGFLLLARLPKRNNLLEPSDFGNHFVIVVKGEGQ